MDRSTGLRLAGYAAIGAIGFAACWFTSAASAQTGTAELGYSNTGANVSFPIGVNRVIADDIFLGSQCACVLDRYEFTVTGGGDGTGPGFTVNYALYQGCPDTGGSIIPGTAGSATVAHNGEHVIVAQIDDSTTVSSPFWLGISTSDPGVGWFTGVAPELGFSSDIYHFPGFACQALFAPTTNLYASFAAQVFCQTLSDPTVQSPAPPTGASGVDTLATVLMWNNITATASASTPDEDQGVARITPESFEDATEHPDTFLQIWRDAIAAGEVPDPAETTLPEPAPRTPIGNVAGGVGVPQVTIADIFPFEDTGDILAGTNFSQGQLFNIMASASNAVTSVYGDEFDFIGFFLNFQAHHQIGAAFYLGIENDVSGLGLSQFNNRPGFGIAGDNIEGWVMMWNQAPWQTGYFTFTQLVLGQEFEHRFGMFLNALPGNRALQGNNGACGRGAHWNFKVDGQGSGMEIREWVGSSPATRVGGTLSFNADIPASVFSYPDLYLMGYVSGPEMDAGATELRYMDSNTSCGTPYSGPISTWGSADIEATNGMRTPNAFFAQKHFRTAWVMIHRPGDPPNNSELTHAVSILNTWNDVYITSTLTRGTMSNVLNPIDQPGPCATLYDVRFGTVDPPSDLICENLIEPMCDPGALNADTEYFWQVTATREATVTDGPVWSFDTFCNIAASDPPNCAIDARQPHAINDANAAQGWNSISLTFACATASVLAEDFSVSVPTGPPPIITNVTLTGNTATLELDRPISPGQWTCVTHVPSGQQTCLGALPADANADRTSGPADILAVIDSLNGIGTTPIYATDADRSGTAGPEDILRVIDLLNGASAFTPWLDATLGVCPSAP